MRKIFTRLLVVLLSMMATTLSAQQLTELEEGAVYRFVNRNTGRALNAGVSDGTYYVNATTVSTTDIKQQWYVTKDGDYYVLRNLEYAKYLKGAVENKVAWSLTDYATDSKNLFNLATSDASWNTLQTNGTNEYNYLFMHDDANSYNGGYRVSSWVNEGANSSHWTITKVEYDADELQTILDEHPTTAEIVAERTAKFVSLFNEGACYTPKYSTLTEAQATTEYQALETELQTLATNIYNKALTTDGWAEANADTEKESWSAEYAKKFRVQMYEPYSIAGDITSWLGINAHANNDNPTGIYVAEAGTVYVMVEGTVKDGASLRLVRAGSNHRITNATGDGYALTTGLNIVNITEVTDGGDHLYICYNVDTYNPNGADDAAKFPHKLSEYDPLKIHIEGGYINGFYNAQGDFRASAEDGSDDLWKVFTGASVDCDDDWEYMEERANLSVIPVLGHRQILLFQLEDVDSNSGMKSLLPETVVLPNSTDETNPNKPYTKTENWDDLGLGISNDSPADYKVNIMMESWDRIMYSELATMGLLSEADINKMNNLYPRWTSEGDAAEIYDLTNASTLDNKTYLEYCNGVDYSEYFNHHGVGLGTESGYMYGGWDHCGYHINTFGSIVSKLSSEAGPTWGPGHEIGHQHQGIFNLNGQTEVTNNMFANIAVWYMGMGTSRYNGSEGALSSVLNGFNVEDNNAYTNNIWALTHMYYRLWLYYHLAGNNTQFMPRLFELCRRDRLENGTTISGDRSLLLFYKHACDAAGEDLTEFFRAHGYLEVMENCLVGDYTSAIYNQTQEMVDEAIAYVKGKWPNQNLAILFINDGTSETTLQHNGTDSRALWDGDATAELGSVNDFIDGDVSALNTVATMNSDGTITMSGDGGVGFLILNENGELVSFSNNSTFALSDEALEAIISGNATFVAVDSENGTTTATVDLSAMQKTILGTLIAKAKPITEKIDDTYTKVGYYKAAAVTELAKVLEYAEEVYAGTSGYEEAYDLLYAEYKKVLANEDAKIPFDPSLTYIITNVAYPTETMWVNDSKVVRSESGVDQTADAAKWQFKETSTPGVYNICNLSGYYCPAVETSTAMTATNRPDTLATSPLYTLEEMVDGVWAIKFSPAAGYRNFHSSWSNVVGWETGNNASRWYLTAVEADPTIADLTNLEVYITKTEALLNEVLGTVTYTRGENIALQTTTSTDAYYIWSNAPCATEGNIANLVDGATNNYFHTEWNGDAVTSGSHYIAVDLGDGNTLPRFAFSHTTRDAADDHAKSVDVYGSDDNDTYKYLGSVSGMPQTSSTFWQFEGMMISSHRYLRFNVHANRGYWHMAEFDIMPVTDFTPTVNDTYSGTVTVETVTAAMEALYDGKGVVSSMSPTTETITSMYETLKEAYENLYEEYEATIDARKATLAQLAANTQALIDEVGTVEIIATVEAKLQTTDSSGDFYVTTNAQSSQEGPIANLVDDSNTTYFHTDYSGADSSDELDHYINIALGSNNATDKFEFSYVTRHDAETNYPTAMIVYGSTDGTTYEQIKEITTDMPISQSATYNSDVIECTKKFTHLRFMVTANNSGTEKGGHPFFHMAEFDLTTIGSTTININSSYNGLVEENLLLTSYHTTNSSTAMSTNDLVTSVPLLDAQIADQQAAYDKLKAATTKVNKTELEELIEATTLLKNDLYEMAVASYNTEEVTLSATEGEAGWLYCNAEGSTNNYDGDNAGIAALLDNDTDTSNFLHTTYYGDDNDDDLDHYLRVDLGENGATDYIQFRYTGRSGYAKLTPSTAVVEATNDLAGEWTTIETLTGLAATTSEVSTGCLGNGNTYRYWRFMVTATHDGRVCDGHPYFALSAFNVDKCTDVVIESQLKYTPDIYIYTTSELVTEVENAITAATEVKNNADATQTDVDTEVGELQAVYDKLAEALKYAGLPITITTDENNPVLYKIISKRDDEGGKVLQFDEPASDKVAIVDVADNASYQAWYFMKGTNGYLIKPFNGDGKMLGVSSTGDAQASATIAETATYAEWNFARSTVAECTDYFYIYVNGTSHACLSHNGGFNATDKMGIWSGGWNTNDGGSLFKFVDAEFENDNARFYQLSDFENTLEFQTSITPEGETVGAFTNGDTYSTAYSTAATLIEAGNTSDAADCYAAYKTLRAASDDLERIEPEAGKIYRIYITPGLTDSRAGASMRIDDNGKLYCDTYAEANARFYFTFEYDAEGNLYMKNLHSATYVDEALTNASNKNEQVGADAEDVADAKAITISTLGKSGETVVVGITPAGGDMLNCAGNAGNVVAYNNTAADKASAWVIEEVETTTVEENVVHSITLAPNTTGDDTTTGYSTLILGYPVTVPDGVTAYIVTNSAIVDNTIELVEYATSGNTIPANFPVILRGSTETAATREFKFNTTSATAADDVENLLGGYNYTTYESCLDEKGDNVYNIYMLTRKSGIVAMRWIYENYDADLNNTGNNDDGGYVKCPANKTYLKLGGTSTASLSTEYFFGFFGGTTDIDGVNTEENPLKGTIYDLQGRKIEEVTVPGFYIVNGKKMFINSELLK